MKSVSRRRGMRVSRGGWIHARIFVLAGVLAGGGLVGSRIAELPGWMTWSLGASGLLGPIVIELLLARADQSTGRARTLRTLAPEAAGAKLPRVRDLQPMDFRVHPSRVKAPFIEREAMGHVSSKLSSLRRALIVGPSMEGKSRLGFELARSLYAAHRLWRPDGGAALKEAVKSGVRFNRTVIWLDDLERFLDVDGATPVILDRLLGNSNVVIATLRSQELLTRLPTKDRNPVDRDVLGWFGGPVHLAGWNSEELERVNARLGDEARRQSERYGLGQYLAGGPQILDHLAVGRFASPVGYSIAIAVAQWRMIGAGNLPASSLQDAVLAVAGEQPTSEELAEGLHWAGMKLNETVSIVEIRDRISINDAALEHFEVSGATISDNLWNLAIGSCDSEELLDVGATAYELYARLDVAERALMASKHRTAPIYLASVWVESGTGNWTQAEALLRATPSDAEGFRDTQLAILLEKQCGGDEAYSEEAERLYQAAAEAGHQVATFNAGMNAVRRPIPDPALAEAYFRAAKELGHSRAAGELGTCLLDRGEDSLAGELFREAAGAGYPLDLARYGAWLVEQGNVEAGEQYLRRAVNADEPSALGHLAQFLANRRHRGDLAEAEALARRYAIQTDQDELLGRILAVSGKEAEADALFRARLAAGELDYAPALADFLAQRAVRTSDRLAQAECEAVLRDAAAQGHRPSAALLGALSYQEWDDPLEGEKWLRLAAEAGDVGAKFNLSTLLLARGNRADSPEIRSLLTSLTECSDRNIRIPAKNNLGLLLEDDGDFAKAESLFMEGATAGRGQAMINVARMKRRRGGMAKLTAIPWELRGRIARLRQVPRRHRQRLEYPDVPSNSDDTKGSHFIVETSGAATGFAVWLPDLVPAPAPMQPRKLGNLIGGTGPEDEIPDPHWRFDPRKKSYFSDVLHIAVPAASESTKVVDWARWPRWFESATGVGNSLQMWWPSRPGPYSARFLCERCGLPFELATGFNFKLVASQGRVDVRANALRWSGGPCPHCSADGVAARGQPLLIVREDGTGTTFITGAHPSLPFQVDIAEGISAEDLRAEHLSIEEATSRLRASRRSFEGLADWLDFHSLPSEAVASIVDAIAHTLGPILTFGDDDDSHVAEAIRGVVRVVLNHFDETRQGKQEGAE